MTGICTAPAYRLKELNNLFIEMTAKNCNQRCKSCYINFISDKLQKDFIQIDMIKNALEDTKSDNIFCIYLTGAEPMTHPDFNAILRLCLKRCNVCICTNGSFLNEKKIRFLSKVESEGENQILFKLSLAHYSEIENDNVKYRGNYRQNIFALKTLSRYNFNSVLAVQNWYNLSQDEIVNNFEKIFRNQEIYNTDIQVVCSHPDYEDKNFLSSAADTDCMSGRILTSNGIYSCPFLSGDYRGRCGSNFKDYSKNIIAESEFCATCSKNNKPIFGIG